MSNRPDRDTSSSDEMAAMLADLLRGKAEGSRIDPLSFAQQRLWFVEQLEPGLSAYNMTAALALEGALDVEALDRSVQDAARRHAMLRAGFESVDGTPVQIVHGRVAVSLERRAVDGADVQPRTTLEERLAEEARRPFNLETPPLFRAVLWTIGPETHVLQLTVHHIVADRQSIEIWFEDVAHAYAAHCRGRMPDWTPQRVQYGDFASWQRDQAAGERFERQLTYWRGKLAPPPVPLRLPGALPRRSPASHAARQVTIRVPRAVGDALQEIGRRERATPFMTLLAAFQALLVRSTGEADVVVGTPIANRPTVDLERVVGLFVNMLVLRTSLAGDPTFRELLARTRETAVDAYTNQEVPFERVVEAVQPRRRSGQTPLFQVYFAFQTTWADGIRFEGIEATPIPVPVTATAFDLNLTITQDAGGLSCAWIYDAEAIEPAAATALASDFQLLLSRIARDPDAPISSLETADRTGPGGPLERPRGVDAYDLSPMQSGMLFHCLHAPRSGAYHVQMIVTVEGGALDVETFRLAWQDLAARHAVLRTSFDWIEGERPSQIVHARADVPVVMLDWADRSRSDQEIAWDDLLKDDQRAGFDLSTPPLMRVVLVRVGPARYEFLWSLHHLILDQWSASLVLNDLLSTYCALASSRLPAPVQRQPYRTFIDWLAGQDRSREKTFWTRAFNGWSGPASIGVGEPVRPGQQPGPTDSRRVSLGSASAAAMRRFLRERRLTSGTLLAAAWALVLSRYSGERDVVFGMVVAGRPPGLSGVEEMVGMFVNTIPVRVRIDEDAPVASWLAGVQETIASFREWEHSSLLDVQGWIDHPRGTPLFETLFVVSPPTRTTGVDAADGVQAFRPRRFEERTNLPLTLAVTGGEEIELTLSYDVDRFGSAAIDRLLEHMRAAVNGMLAQPAARVADVSTLTARERQQLVAWNRTSRARSPHRAIHHLFEEQAARTPHALAVDDLGSSMTYADLDARASVLAATLRRKGVGPNVLVGISIERSIDMIVMTLGVLKAGGAYVPLDAGAPGRRLNAILDETGIRLVLTSEQRRGVFASTGRETLVLSAQQQEGDAPFDPAPAAESEGDHLAYVIYTSGSTGRPKGVMVTHRNLVHSTVARTWAYPEPVGRFLLLSPFVFDSAVAGIFWTLCTGGCLVLPDERRQLDVSWLAGQIAAARVTHLLAIPAFYAELLEADASRLSGLTAAIVAGEACSGNLVARHHAALPGVALYNEYGPTEATVWATVHTCRPEDGGTVPIGRPVPNTTVWILDDRQRLIPPGVTGEIYIGGDGVAAGYLGRPDLTAERFLRDPFGAGDARLYRTGDRARYRADGSVEFLGRLDDQVKVRGFRIEVGEIEAVLMQHPSVLRAAVTARVDGPGGTRLAGFVSARHGMTIPVEALRAFARSELPDYMVPADLVVVEEWPTTETGKIDRRALPDPHRSAPGPVARTAARSPLEERVADIWSTVLKLPAVGVEENFFELGGHSLLAMQVVSRIRRAFGVDLPIAVLFERPTIAELCPEIAELSKTTPAGQPARERTAGADPPAEEIMLSARDRERSLRQVLYDGR